VSTALSPVALSKAVSHALRHRPWLYELELDAQGWAPVGQLLDALRARGGPWLALDRRRLEEMIESSDKRRFELDGDRIRALYGHSLPARIEREAAQPPALLFHGTDSDSWRSIADEGLRPMRRQYVHLSVDAETAQAVGRRKSRCPVVLGVAAADAAATGVRFYVGNDNVWLADHVPAEFLELLEDPSPGRSATGTIEPGK
jgi:putative RNA 2'-phosphotransferase